MRKLSKRSIKVLMELLKSTGYPPVSIHDMLRRIMALKYSADIIKKLDKCEMVYVILHVLGVNSLNLVYEVMHKIMKRRITFDEIKLCLGLSDDIDVWVFLNED